MRPEARIERHLVPVALDGKDEPVFKMRDIAMAFAESGAEQFAYALVVPDDSPEPLRVNMLLLAQREADRLAFEARVRKASAIRATLDGDTADPGLA